MAYSSKYGNYILYTPFDSKAIVDKKVVSSLSGEEFLNQCYVEPRFKQSINVLIDEHDIEPHDCETKLDELRELLRKQSDSESVFLEWLDDPNNSKVYTIGGNAGTGKTTYINKLKQMHTEKDWVILDIAETKDIIHWFGSIHTYISGFNTMAHYKIYAILLQEISNIFFKFYNEDNTQNLEQICNNLKMIIENYNNIMYNKFPSGKEFFEEIEEIYTGTYVNIEIAERLASFLRDYFEQIVNLYKNNIQNIWRDTLDILLLLLQCVNFSDKLCVIVFDNLERFIAHDEIYNQEVDEMRKQLISYNRMICNKNHYHYGKFKLIMTMRNNSVRMCGVKLHSADELASNVDLSEWFIVDQIISRKKAWYKSHNIELTDTQLIESITGDLRKCQDGRLTGLQLEIDALFNNNKRLIVDFIGQILENGTNATYIKKYQELWSLDTPISRFAARSIIRGLILKELNNNDNLFVQLRLFSEEQGSVKQGLGYTRKILSLLFNHKESMPLTQILGEICNIDRISMYWNDGMPEKTQKDISAILYYMNSYNRRDNDWIQFIDMQICDTTKSVSAEDEEGLKKIISTNMADFSLQIMPAGEAYLEYIVASFEYFSFRYYKNHVPVYKPLFATLPTVKELHNCKNIYNLECCKILNYVTERAKDCILILKTDIDINLQINSTTSKPHYLRIIEQHQGYIDNFISYLEIYYDSNDCKELINICRTYKDSYTKYR